jgi:hypothetical protein
LVRTPGGCNKESFRLSSYLNHLFLPAIAMAANSTLMFSGFNPNARNSSKVLLPPGGGSSDIFGLKEEQPEEMVTPVQEEKANMTVDGPSTAEEAPNTNNEPTVEDIQPPADAPKEEFNKTPAETSVTQLPEFASPTVAPSSSDPSPTPPVAGVRGRIPPGGHSSGSFW